MKLRGKSALACSAVGAAGMVALLGAGPAQAATSQAWYAASICGSGYSPDATFGLQGGTVYVAYNGYTDCAVNIKTVDVGTPTDTWVYIGYDGTGTGGYGGNQGDGMDSGSFSYYAGPVYVDAPGVCIEVAGGTTLSGDEKWWPGVLCG
jgi:hypothetical protein